MIISKPANNSLFDEAQTDPSVEDVHQFFHRDELLQKAEHRVDKEVLDEKVEEVSSMAGGSVEGAARKSPFINLIN